MPPLSDRCGRGAASHRIASGTTKPVAVRSEARLRRRGHGGRRVTPGRRVVIECCTGEGAGGPGSRVPSCPGRRRCRQPPCPVGWQRPLPSNAFQHSALRLRQTPRECFDTLFSVFTLLICRASRRRTPKCGTRVRGASACLSAPWAWQSVKTPDATCRGLPARNPSAIPHLHPRAECAADGTQGRAFP